MSNDIVGERVPGKRLFVAGCVVLLVFSTVHMIPMFLSLLTEPTKPPEIEAKRAMSAAIVDIGPARSDWMQLHHLLSVSYSVLLYVVAAINLVALGPVVAAGRLRRLAVVNAVFAFVLVGVAVMFTFPPPGVFSFVAGVLFAMAGVKARGGDGETVRR